MRSVLCVFFNIEAGCRYNVNGDNAIAFSAATTSFKNARGRVFIPPRQFPSVRKDKKTRQLVSHAIETNCELSISSFISTFRLYVP
mgnify:CR=1 FL=1